MQTPRLSEPPTRFTPTPSKIGVHACFLRSIFVVADDDGNKSSDGASSLGDEAISNPRLALGWGDNIGGSGSWALFLLPPQLPVWLQPLL